MKTKVYRGRLEFKADADKTGQFEAEFATLGVIDLDQDVTEAGAFEDGQETMIEAWNHNYGQLPVGKGVIRERDDKAVVEGAFFLDTQGGQEHYKTVKALGPLGEWSYTFTILDALPGKFEGQDVRLLRKLDVWGVAPVQRGAGIDTRTVDIKAGARHTAKEFEMLQSVHDKAVELGATCPGHDDTGGDGEDGDGDQGEAGDGKSRGPGRETLAARVAMELIEAGVN